VVAVWGGYLAAAFRFTKAKIGIFEIWTRLFEKNDVMNEKLMTERKQAI
jgi:hypothetical protein